MFAKLQNDIVLIIKQFVMNGKTLLKNKFLFLFSFLFIFLALAIPVIFIPIIFSLPIVLQLATLMPLAIVFGSLSSNWRKSTLYTQAQITKTNRYNQNIAIISVMFIYCFILTLTIFFFIFILSKFNFLMINWMSHDVDLGGAYIAFSLNNFNWGLIFYSQIINVLIIFSFCFFIQRVTNDQKTFHSIFLILILLLVIFGGTLNDYFDQKQIQGEDEEIRIIPIWTGSYMMPTNTYYFSIFIPLFSTGQQIAYVGENFWLDSPVWIWLPSTEECAWKWNILWIIPYIQITFFCVSGILISNLKNNIN